MHDPQVKLVGSLWSGTPCAPNNDLSMQPRPVRTSYGQLNRKASEAPQEVKEDDEPKPIIPRKTSSIEAARTELASKEASLKLANKFKGCDFHGRKRINYDNSKKATIDRRRGGRWEATTLNLAKQG